MNCINCNAIIPDNKLYCNDLCIHGFKTRMHREFEKEWKKAKGYVEQ